MLSIRLKRSWKTWATVHHGQQGWRRGEAITYHPTGHVGGLRSTDDRDRRLSRPSGQLAADRHVRCGDRGAPRVLHGERHLVDSGPAEDDGWVLGRCPGEPAEVPQPGGGVLRPIREPDVEWSRAGLPAQVEVGHRRPWGQPTSHVRRAVGRCNRGRNRDGTGTGPVATTEPYLFTVLVVPSLLVTIRETKYQPGRAQVCRSSCSAVVIPLPKFLYQLTTPEEESMNLRERGLASTGSSPQRPQSEPPVLGIVRDGRQDERIAPAVNREVNAVGRGPPGIIPVQKKDRVHP